MFDYLGVLISVILGLALTHMLTGVSRMIQLRGEVRIWWPQLVWTAAIVVYVLAIWWGMYWWRGLSVWTVQAFFFLAGYAALLFILGSLLFPAEVTPGTDMEAHFFRNRRWFFGALMLAGCTDLPETYSKSIAGLRGMPREYLVFFPAWMAVCVVGLISRDRRVQAGLSVAFLLMLLAYMTFSSLDRIASH